MSANLDFYEQAGGDAAWQLWFELCAVHRVGEINPAFEKGLAAEIESAMYGQLSKMGIAKEAMNGTLPHLHFDSYFLADSTRKEAESNKPLKKHYKNRLAMQDRPLKEFICGTIFSSTTGRVRDIARDWVETELGWKPHSIKGADGKRCVIWECAAEKEDASVRSGGVVYRFGGRLDRETLKADVENVFNSISSELGMENRAVAFLFYTVAQGISIDTPVVLDALGCKKSTAYNLQNKCMVMSDKLFREKDVETNDLMFAQVLLHTCERYIGKETVEQLAQRTSADK